MKKMRVVIRWEKDGVLFTESSTRNLRAYELGVVLDRMATQAAKPGTKRLTLVVEVQDDDVER